MIESFILAFFLICVEIPGYQLNQKENRIYEELLVFFSRVKHRYMACRNISNAIILAAEGMEYEIQRLAEEIVQVLLEGDRREKIKAYIKNNRTNRYIKLFLIQAYEVSENGNRYFSDNVEHLRLDLMEEIYRRKRRNFEFSGYVFVAVTPFFMMPVLKHWGKQFTPDLELFYSGMGIILEAITFGITVFIYRMIVKTKELTFFIRKSKVNLLNLEHIYDKKLLHSFICWLDHAEGKFSCFIRRLLIQSDENISYGRFCLRILICVFSFLIIFVLTGTEIKRKEKNAILNSSTEIEILLPIATEEKREKIEKHILDVSRQCIESDIVEEKQISVLLKEKVRLHNEAIEKEVVKEIKSKILRYKSTVMSWKEILIGIMLSLGTGFLPVFQLSHQSGKIREEAVHEVRQFQSIILMERKLQGITILGLLEDMEVFSKYFRNCLKRCINSYGNDPDAALLRLKKEGTELYGNFGELADAFLSVDEVGIEIAFEEVESNRKLLEKMVQLEAEITLENKKDVTELLAKIPAFLVVGIYFILPVFMYSLRGVYEVFELLEEMQL